MTHCIGNAILVSFVVLKIAGSSDILSRSQLLENAKFQELPGALPPGTPMGARSAPRPPAGMQ